MSDTPDLLSQNVPTVLVVEDEVLIRITIAQYLRHCGYRVLEAPSASEAIIALTETAIKIDMVFSDIEMPGEMDGFGLAQWAKKHRPEIPVILVGTIERAAAAAGQLCEEGPHFKKPYEPQQVVEHIKQMLASRGKK